jgi:hypothetical protein
MGRLKESEEEGGGSGESEGGAVRDTGSSSTLLEALSSCQSEWS